MLAVAGVDDVGPRHRGDDLRGTDVRVPDDDPSVVGGESERRVLEPTHPRRTDEPDERSDIVSAESRLAASSKLDSVRVDDS